MDVVTAAEMRMLDRHTIDRIGIPALVLMENAGSAIAGEVLAIRGQMQRTGTAAVRNKCWLVLAGKGNNGGDGLVAARHLSDAGVDVAVVLAEPPDRLSGEAAKQYEIVRKLGMEIRVYGDGAIDWAMYEGVVDALLGTGTSGAPRGVYASLIREANASGLPIVAADLPSGVDADTGQTHDPCIRAACTVALAFLKRGLIQHPGAEAAGRVVVRPIGIPPRLARELGVRTQLLSPDVLAAIGAAPDQPRRADSHKGTYGRVLIAAGTQRMSGAGLLCARAALRAGCGLATWAVPASLAPHLLGRLPEAMIAPVPDAGHGDWAEVSAEALLKLAAGCDAMVIGPGMGRYTNDAQWLRDVWEGAPCPLVVDADALNMIADAPDFADWQRREWPTVLTPHPGEMARLTGMTVAEVQRDRIGVAVRYAAAAGVTVALKGAFTVVATPEGEAYINPTGNAGMAKGGTGDALAGIIASLLAQGRSAEQAACLGVYRHGEAGDRAVNARPSPGSLLASDLIEHL